MYHYHASSSLHKCLVLMLDSLNDHGHNTSKGWKIEVVSKVIENFKELYEGIVTAVKSYPSDVTRKSSTTLATALFNIMV